MGWLGTQSKSCGGLISGHRAEVIFCSFKFCGMGYITFGVLSPLKGRFKCIQHREQIQTDSVDFD